MADELSDRETRADRYFKHDLKDQLEWYAKRASAYKNWTQLLGFGVIFAGAATSFLQVFSPASWVPPLTAGLGALIALSEGWQRIARYGEIWVALPHSSERMREVAYAQRRRTDRGVFLSGAALCSSARCCRGLPASFRASDRKSVV